MHLQKSLWMPFLWGILALYILQNVTSDNKGIHQTDQLISVDEPSLMIRLDYEVLVEAPRSPQLLSSERSQRQTHVTKIPEGITEALGFLTAVITLIATCINLRDY